MTVTMSSDVPQVSQPPQTPPPYPYQPGLDHDGETAKTMVLIGMILQVVLLVLGIFSPFFFVGILWVILDFVFVYSKLSEGRLNEAETPCLVLAILQLLFGGVLPGIFLLIGYVKLKDSIRNRMAVHPPPPSY